MHLTPLTLMVSLMACTPKHDGPPDMAPQGLSYPVTKAVEQVDNYHGTQVSDPYRWLEDTDAEDTKAWVTAQNELTFKVLNAIPGRDAIRARMTALWDFERTSAPGRRGGVWFWSFNDGLMNQAQLFVGTGPYEGGRVLIDPNTLSEDGTVALSGTFPSDDGKHLVYSLSKAGSDWQELRVRDVATGQDLPDLLQHIKFSEASWTKDGKGFFYSAYDPPKDPNDFEQANYYQKLYYHRLGEPQSADKLIYQRADQPEWGFGGAVTEDGNTLVIPNWQGTEPKNRVFLKDLKTPDSPVVELIGEFDAYYSYIGNDGPLFYFSTDQAAPKGRVIAIDITKPARANWKELIPQQAEPLESVSLVSNRFLVTRLKDAKSLVEVYDISGKKLSEVALPGLGSAGGFSGRREDKEVYYSFTSYMTPGAVYRYDVLNNASTLVKAPTVSMDEAAYEVKQVFYPSKDGTKIPMFIVHKKGMALDGTNPTYLYGYGGFNIPLTPGYSTVNRVWLELGGVYAVANLRGGGEYGQEWHDAGRLANKQNVFDDFHAAAEYLIAEGYTTTPTLAIGGRSNGGLLVGAAITQRPDLYGAALPGVGVLDMLRFHKFTIGWAWVSDYGSADDPTQFQWLYAYSPLHNIKPGAAYPATLITTGDHDDRVVPGHSFKFAAALQAAQGGPEPILIRVDVNAGHGAGKPTAKTIEEWVDQWAFLVDQLGVTVPPDFGTKP